MSKTTRYNVKGKMYRKIKFYLFTGVNAELLSGSKVSSWCPKTCFNTLPPGGQKNTPGQARFLWPLRPSPLHAAARGAEQYPWAKLGKACCLHYCGWQSCCAPAPALWPLGKVCNGAGKVLFAFFLKFSFVCSGPPMFFKKKERKL